MPKQEVAQTKIFLIKGKLAILLLGLFFCMKMKELGKLCETLNFLTVFLYLIVLIIVLQVSC